MAVLCVCESVWERESVCECERESVSVSAQVFV